MRDGAMPLRLVDLWSALQEVDRLLIRSAFFNAAAPIRTWQQVASAVSIAPESR
jgi:hypothetical protein